MQSYSECQDTNRLLISEDLSIKTIKEHTKNILGAVDSKANEPWLLVIGETDCFSNILVDSITSLEPIDDVLEEYVEKLVRFLSVLNRNYVVYACSVSPTGDYSRGECEYYAPREIRQVITSKFNSRLKSVCAKKGVPLLEVWKVGASPKDMVPLAYFEADRKHIKGKIASNLLKTSCEECNVR